jgi:oxaloacetate decarboxylase gamma subunit
MEGIKFMFLGMGTVFLFLTVLIVLMNVMSAVLHKLFPETIPVVPGEEKQKQADNKKIVAAITAAVIHHRKG